MRAALYARVSTERQAEKYGLEAQITGLLNRASDRGYEVIRDGKQPIFADDGFTGGDLNRPAFARLRQVLNDGLLDVVLCYDPDRLSRNLSDLLLFSDEVKHYGARLEFITQEVDWSPEGTMFFSIRGAVAQYEKAKIRERTARGREQKARQGRIVNPRNLPYALVCNPENGKVEVDQEKAYAVKLAYQLLVEQGMNLPQIGRRFEELGIHTPTGGVHWCVTTLQHWLRSPAYKGELSQLRMEPVEPKKRLKPALHSAKNGRRERPRDQWHKVTVPAIVPSDLWEQAQKRLEQNKTMASRNVKRDYLLRGLVRCSICGCRLAGSFTSQRYYVCSRHGKGKADVHGNYCSSKPVRADSLEAAVWESVTKLLMDPETLREELRRRREEGSPTRGIAEQELRLARKRLADIPREQDRLVEGYGKGLLPDDLMGARMDALKVEREELLGRVAELERQLTRLDLTEEQEVQALAFARQMTVGLDNLTFPERQQLLRLLVEDVACYDTGIRVRTIIPLRHTETDESRLRTTLLGGF